MRCLNPRVALFGVALLGTTAGAYAPPSNIASVLDKYRGYGELTSAAGSMDLDTYAKNMITWQMDHGGFSKAHASLYAKAWDGKAELSSWSGTRSEPLGMFDNNATVQEMRLLAVRYKATTNSANKQAFKAAFVKAVGFVLNSQLSNGGWPQVYPKRGNYSDMATYNDNAMVRVMVMVKDIVEMKAPFDSDILTSAEIAKLEIALDKAVEFALKAQIVNGGSPTVWCAQHDPSTYKPVGARAYELASKSGSESAGVVWFLMNWPDQTAAVQKAVKGALAWYRKNKVSDLKFSNGAFVASSGASMWYRFYEVDDDQYFFCDRDGASTKTQDISKLSEERRTGYQWAGDYGSSLLSAEKAYLAAVPVSVAPRSGFAGDASFAGGRISVSGLADGIWHIRAVDATGATSASLRAVAIDGRVEVPSSSIPASGSAYLVLAGPGGDRRTVRLPAIR